MWYAGNSPGTGEFPAQMASNAENGSIWWRQHGEFIEVHHNIAPLTLMSLPWLCMFSVPHSAHIQSPGGGGGGGGGGGTPSVKVVGRLPGTRWL